MIDMYGDDRIVLTLDAGGTNFIFNAYSRGKPMLEGFRKNAHGADLDRCLESLISGFKEVLEQTGRKAVAISFAFPGPADYTLGIIDNENNLPAFKGGVPLKDILEEAFGLPVFINNDGDLFAYGEALAGILPEINARLKASGNPKRYKNLVGFTLGTGFGGGFVSDGRLITGDNVTAAEVWLFSNRFYPDVNTEEVVSIRSVLNFYAEENQGNVPEGMEPRDIHNIALGKTKGNQAAARRAFERMGAALGDAVANVLTFTDGIAVFGGGITGARDLYMPAMLMELRSTFNPSEKTSMPRLVQQVFNLDDENERRAFYRNYSKELHIPGTGRTVKYDPVPRLAVATSRNGASTSISLGAYAFALQQIGQS